MYREAGARRGVQFNPECPHSVLPTVERGQRREPKNKAIQVHASVCLRISCLWDLTMGRLKQPQLPSAVLNSVKTCKNLSSKYILYKYEIIVYKI